MSNPVFETIRTTRSVRFFKEAPLPDEVIHLILEAGRRSGSAKNTQPWHFVVIRNRETLTALSVLGDGAGHLARAAMAVALVTEVPYTRDSVPFDLGRAAQNMMVAARSEGVGSVMATLYQTDRAAEALKLPAGLTVPWCISFGYPAEEPAGPPRKGGRRSFEEVVHWEKW